ncbi:restriction endonuclease subunit S [Streptococcus oralis]|uniref:Type I restriction-modification system, specificity subunit S n=1 Tax=Streptococcus oralis TaxID=1303 RepID=A0A139QZ35_STROR|nr:restriction endonuclease subunit S [Streptococcus oralis]KXU07776.1 Type I restriction-modification system, specificity subunit S [Streptococcus oralis]
MEEKILPILRFDNFNDYWQKSSLLSQVEVRRGLTYKPNDVRSNGARVLRSSNIVDDSFVISDDDVFVSKDVINIPRVSNGDILVTAANGSTKLVGKHAIIKNLPDDEIVVHGGFMLLFKTEQNYFVNAWMSSNEYKRVLQFVQGGNGAIGNLSSAILKSMKMSVPFLPEQSAIGSLFSTLDDLLAGYKDNLTNYQSLKSTMLSKMFPKAGQTVPEIRLDGFEGKWKEVQLSDICKKVIEKNKDNNFNETFTNSAEFGIINQRDFFDKDISNEKSLNTYYVVRNNDFVYNPRISNYAPVGPVKRNRLGRTGVMSPLYFVFRVVNLNIDLDFLETFFNTNTWHKFMKLNGDSGARADRFAIKDSIFLQMPIVLPSISEQQAIGAYFSNLDNLIATHQDKISQLETLKKKLLQDMFI